ncbi:hypothetical protein PpBr36_08509 [Pyricularia pennisetigena]|uniref:hypothetical protein n=1 Tax=Pyricularia pennisetigena TaxID=1578925 RepID=UPI0011524E40|nr:hypothetical protein PpBr36_08509 [Pyricularia pennisetigena]TLS24223.1 hypothetical protein PpBr36_08509 [Pyricularia pennisetigena]
MARANTLACGFAGNYSESDRGECGRDSWMVEDTLDAVTLEFRAEGLCCRYSNETMDSVGVVDPVRRLRINLVIQ